MNKQKFIFIWVLSTGWNGKEQYPIIKCGSDGIAYADGKWNKTTLEQEARKLAKQRKGIGYSVGYLNSHDPQDEYAQKIIPYTAI